jgi:4-amino-4-deoxy-L-arabinose transferase-like glycosyltransferase
VSVVVVLIVASAAVSIGSRDVWAPDEPRYALVAKEMLASGEWLIPHLNGELYPDKPPLLFWSIAAASRVTGGVGQPAAVLPSLIAMLVALAGAARLAWLLAGRRDALVPVLAVGLLGISFRFVMQAGFGQIDMLLCACTTWGFALLVEGVGWDEDHPPRPGLVVASYAVMGLGILAKGPVALICPLGGFVVGALLARRRPLVRRALRPLAWAALLGVVGAWLVPAAVHALTSGHEAWLTNILFKQTAVRYAASWHHHRPLWYMLAVPLYDFQPAIWLLPGALWALLRPGSGERRPCAHVLLAGAFLFIVVFFSIPSGKRGLYLLPAYPLVAVWLASYLAARIRGLQPARWPRAAAGMVALLGAALVVATLTVLPREVAEEGLDAPLWPLTVAFALVTLGALAAAWRPRATVSWAAAWAPWVLLWGVTYAVVFPAADPEKSAAVLARTVEQRTIPEASGGIVDFRARFGIHLGRLESVEKHDEAGLDRLVETLEGGEPFWVIVREAHLDRLERRLGPGADVVTIHRDRLGDKRYLVLANRAALAAPAGPGEEIEP